MATPTLTMIPSGYKAQKVYSVLPTNGDGDFTFDRNNAGTRVNKDGLIEQVATDVPRLDYSDGSCPSLLLEPSSVNLITKSNEVTSVSGAIINLNAAISPDGTLNAFKIKFTGGSSNAGGLLNLENQTANFAASTLYTLSFYAKNLVGNGQFTARIDTDVSIVKQESFTATSNWQKYTVSFTTDVGSTTFSSNSRFRNFQENGEVLFYGVQLEKGIATSLIPTTTNTQSRSVDSAFKTGLSSYISSTAGVLYAEFAGLSNVLDGTYKVLTLKGAAGGANVILLGITSANKIYASVGGTFISDVTPSDITAFNKVAIKYENNNSKLFVNGVQIGATNTTATVPSGLSRLGLDSGNGGSKFHVKARDLRVYNTALTDAKLTTLTTI
tara:strand:+ start:381 stop:1532 length:1152 start_codon:yes stop_codon:yes gene_type:complete